MDPRVCLIKRALDPATAGSTAYRMMSGKLGKSRHQTLSRLIDMFTPVEEAERRRLGYVRSPVDKILSGAVKSSALVARDLSRQLGNAEAREQQTAAEAQKLRTVQELSEFGGRSPFTTASHGAAKGSTIGALMTAIPALMTKKWWPLLAGAGVGGAGGAALGYQLPGLARDSLRRAVEKGSPGIAVGATGEGTPSYANLTPKQKELVRRLSRLAERKHG